jgi:hypothetical protein
VGTLTWNDFRISDTTYGIFDSFETEESRQGHLGGETPTALGQVAADLLAKEPDIRTVNVIASSNPAAAIQKVTDPTEPALFRLPHWRLP